MEFNMGVDAQITREATIFANFGYDVAFCGDSYAFDGNFGIRVMWRTHSLANRSSAHPWASTRGAYDADNGYVKGCGNREALPQFHLGLG